MNTSNQSYKELSIPFFKETFDCIDNIMQKHKVPYYLIGVSAIALELLKDGIKPSRGTKDIDFAIMISSMRDYEAISIDLEKQGFNKVKAPWTFYSDTYKVAIDLLPFGEIEEKDTENFNKRNAELHLLGFKEVLEEAEQVQIGEKIANIPPLPGMIILKLIAWSDRPEERENDLEDILKIIQNYFDLAFDEIVEEHHDTFPEGELDQILVAAEVLGRKARKILQKSQKLSDRINVVLKTNLANPEHSQISKELARRLGRDIEYAKDILMAFQKGISY
ncbi:hypothetical protein [Marinilabilia salmonicolor]|uniref:Putative nucleotidyltransferase n=1 Tax=Marinilabilia salmonicolor TaxID=989 RepID=A0A368UKU4_9BACT|nr:hypothetical protein [Marinilabilia salmonicolor]RCW29299.1 putative nucleotidyltransferase [Marinilabilia salmonicolor]